jgi:hypothetical protein
MTTPAPRKKTREPPARKIVPRVQMGMMWVIGSFVIAGAILVLGIIFLLTHSH